MNERKLKKEQELVVRDWEDGVNPFTYFLLISGAIFIYTQTRLFEASPGFFRAKNHVCRRKYHSYPGKQQRLQSEPVYDLWDDGELRG